MRGLDIEESHISISSPVNVTLKETKNGFILTFMTENEPVSIITLDRRKVKNMLLNNRQYFIFKEAMLGALY